MGPGFSSSFFSSLPLPWVDFFDEDAGCVFSWQVLMRMSFASSSEVVPNNI